MICGRYFYRRYDSNATSVSPSRFGLYSSRSTKAYPRDTNHQIEETFHPTPRRFRVRQRNFSSKEDAGPYHFQLRNVRARPKQHHLTRRSVRKQWNRIERFSVTEFVPFGALPRSLRSTWRLNAGFSRCTADDGPAARRCRVTGKTTLSTDPRLTPN